MHKRASEAVSSTREGRSPSLLIKYADSASRPNSDNYEVLINCARQYVLIDTDPDGEQRDHIWMVGCQPRQRTFKDFEGKDFTATDFDVTWFIGLGCIPGEQLPGQLPCLTRDQRENLANSQITFERLVDVQKARITQLSLNYCCKSGLNQNVGDWSLKHANFKHLN